MRLYVPIILACLAGPAAAQQPAIAALEPCGGFKHILESPHPAAAGRGNDGRNWLPPNAPLWYPDGTMADRGKRYTGVPLVLPPSARLKAWCQVACVSHW